MASTKIFAYYVIALLFLFALNQCVVTSLNVGTLCIKEERMTLLKIKKDLSDPSNCLSTWIGKDCCNWIGIQCDNQTGHILKLDLQQYRICTDVSSTSPLSGKINPSLNNLTYLNHLDLSYNNFQGVPIPEFFGSLNKLNYLDLSNANFSGMIPTQLGNLSNLHYLDLSYNYFEGVPIPKFIGSLNMLSYLDLSHANFSGMIPIHLGNLSNLHYLDITDPLSTLWVRDISWLSSLSSLQYLNIGSVNITDTPHELFGAVNMMPSLFELYFSYCNLGVLPPSSPFSNITSLSVLYLNGNPFNSSIPSWLFNMSSLTTLGLSSSSLRGLLPSMLGSWKLCKLQDLDLSNNYLTGDTTETIEALSCSNQSLMYLDMSTNQLTGKLPHFIGKFNSLYDLDLSTNSVDSHSGVSGPIPASIGNLSNLGSLNLEGNMMNGTIPESIGQLTKLYSLNLLENYWEGTMTNIHFHNLTNLLSFSVSSKNNTLDLKVTNDWVPPFKHLSHIEIRNCEVGPTFPYWLINLKFLHEIIIQKAGISGEIPPWLYNMSSQIWNLDLSNNKISGYLPKTMNFTCSISPTADFSYNQLKGSLPLWSCLSGLYLRNNLLSGIVPTNIGEEVLHLRYLDLSNNYLNGRIPISMNKIQNLSYIDLSNNYLMGEIPEFWMGMQNLEIIDLSSNRLSGGIPTSICSLPFLYILELSNNNLSANFTLTFQNCPRMKTLSLENNVIFGSIPKQITKNLPFLSELLLRGNLLTGSIPKELCRLPSLHLLDLAENNLSGSIPTCMGDVHGFKLPQTHFIDFVYSLKSVGYVPYTRHTELVLNGRIVEYLKQMPMHSTIDLSKNNLSGEIPEKITQLIHLGALNLSWNRLTGNIPSDIGLLKDLENLDLSHNNLSGSIPPSMASMTFLSHLNLSYNNLSGRIPLGNQFGTYDASTYIGNPELCGDHLLTSCSSLFPENGEQERKHEDSADGDDDKTERLGLYASIAVGFITGFWVVCGSLVLKRSWRHAYFNFVFDMRDKLLVLMAVYKARVKHKFGLERN
ncbi:receptor protein EIX2 [Trifolium repens]|nr:receptor protein EIX2 [Trifolium repens]